MAFQIKAYGPAISILRWLLTAPVALAGFYIGLLVFGLIYEINERWCPEAYLVSGMCHAPWSWHAGQFAVVLGAFVSGALVVLLPALTAPSHRKAVALLFYALGLACALFVWMSGMHAAKIAAAVGGAISVWRIHDVGVKVP